MKLRALGTMGMCLAGALAQSCAVSPPKPPTYPALPKTQPAAQASDDAARMGGRLYDSFWKELKIKFVPDNAKTPEADGQGGPFNNGTLPDAQGKPMLNPGHDYRLKNLMGWDLHGKAGITGLHHADDHCVLLPDLLKNGDPRAVWIERLTKGEDAIPAYGSLLTSTQIGTIVDFMLGVRDGTLPQPDDLFTLDDKVAGFYRLNTTGNAERGHKLIASTCANCHGKDGTAFKLEDETMSLGAFLRMNASEAWLKILNGAPGTTMGPQLPIGASREQLTQDLRDLFAAGCDRARYPQLPGISDVPDGDARCGTLLK